MDESSPVSGWRPSTPEISGDDIDRLAQRGPLAIHFWAPWNRIDVSMDKSIQAIVPRFAGRVEFVSCNVDAAENAELCRRCRFMNIPAVSVLVDRIPRRPIIGYREPDQLAQEIESRLLADVDQPIPWWAFWRRAR